MARFLVEIPVRVTREPAFAIDYEPTQERAVKFTVDAEDEDEAVEIVSLLLLNEIEADDADDVIQVLS